MGEDLHKALTPESPAITASSGTPSPTSPRTANPSLLRLWIGLDTSLRMLLPSLKAMLIEPDMVVLSHIKSPV